MSERKINEISQKNLLNRTFRLTNFLSGSSIGFAYYADFEGDIRQYNGCLRRYNEEER